jgi:drug/metabolite transporter (DMT)-like permease
MNAKLSIAAAIGAALLFGASTPFAKSLGASINPIMLAGLLYLGSGIGLWMIRMIRDGGYHSPGLTKAEWPWLAGSVIAGGVLAPVLLMLGLTQTSAADASLLLNLEAVLTAGLAWLVFKENADRRIVLGMAFIVAGGAVLAWPSDQVATSLKGAFAITGACLLWAIDNNLTRKVSASDAFFIAGTKGLVAGTTNLGLALSLGAVIPTWNLTGAAMLTGLVGYGASLVLFVLALRGLGSARTGAYFSTAPFVGAAIAISFFGEPTSPAFWIAAALMGVGVGIHLIEHHEHAHTHEPLVHTHAHRHDEHHQHEHSMPLDGVESHSHEHQHQSITHKHDHFPDIHHRHSH